jgi:hypothetical protein
MNRTSIDWARMARPQADGYDTRVTLALAAEQGYCRPTTIAAPTFLGGAISLQADPELLFPDICQPAQPNHVNVATAESLLRLWPEGAAQCQQLLHRITLFQMNSSYGDMVIGSICGPGTEGFGSIAATVDHHVGFAEGIVHEMGHHKLRTLGVDFESAEHLLLNDPAQLLPSPIRYDCLRPISAVLHAQYSYTYILQLDLQILEGALDRERDRTIVRHSLAIIAPKLEFGRNVLQRHAQPDTEGEPFLEDLYSWTDAILDRCDRWLDEFQVAPEVFQHPIVAN